MFILHVKWVIWDICWKWFVLHFRCGTVYTDTCAIWDICFMWFVLHFRCDTIYTGKCTIWDIYYMWFVLDFRCSTVYTDKCAIWDICLKRYTIHREVHDLRHLLHVACSWFQARHSIHRQVCDLRHLLNVICSFQVRQFTQTNVFRQDLTLFYVFFSFKQFNAITFQMLAKQRTVQKK